MAWGHTCGLTFSSSKTVAVLFSKHTKPLAFIPPLYLDGVEIEYKDSAKYLGVTLDRQLNFKEHIKQKTTKAKQLLAISRKALGTFWGPCPQLNLWAYQGMVRPALTYGSHLWAQKTTQVTFKKLATRIQRQALSPMGPV